jgi:hypothetical protein
MYGTLRDGVFLILDLFGASSGIGKSWLCWTTFDNASASIASTSSSLSEAPLKRDLVVIA